MRNHSKRNVMIGCLSIVSFTKIVPVIGRNHQRRERDRHRQKQHQHQHQQQQRHRKRNHRQIRRVIGEDDTDRFQDLTSKKVEYPENTSSNWNITNSSSVRVRDSFGVSKEECNLSCEHGECRIETIIESSKGEVHNQYCFCDFGYRGKSCEKKFNVCGDRNNPLDNQPLQCLNGAPCAYDATSSENFCDCSVISSTTRAFAGLSCEYGSTSICHELMQEEDDDGTGSSLDGQILFCTNGGTCPAKELYSSQVNISFSCVCPHGFMGNQCQYTEQEFQILQQHNFTLHHNQPKKHSYINNARPSQSVYITQVPFTYNITTSKSSETAKSKEQDYGIKSFYANQHEKEIVIVSIILSLLFMILVTYCFCFRCHESNRKSDKNSITIKDYDPFNPSRKVDHLFDNIRDDYSERDNLSERFSEQSKSRQYDDVVLGGKTTFKDLLRKVLSNNGDDDDDHDIQLSERSIRTNSSDGSGGFSYTGIKGSYENHFIDELDNSDASYKFRDTALPGRKPDIALEKEMGDFSFRSVNMD